MATSALYYLNPDWPPGPKPAAHWPRGAVTLHQIDNVAARLQLEALDHDLPEPVPGSLERARTHLQSAVEEGRRLIQDLRPSGLTELGLVGTLRTLLEDLGQEFGWVTDLQDNLGSQPLSPTLETTLYRIVQEALNNTRKHAQARSVAINLKLQDNWIHLQYQDEGSGFDPALQRTGVGLQSMKERAEVVGGWLQLTSAVGGGTIIHAGLPFQPPGPSGASA